MTFAFRTPALPEPTDTRQSQPLDAPVHNARRLTGPDLTGYIQLDGTTYVLRITRAGKLILTK